MDDSQARKFQKDLNAGLVALVLLAVLERSTEDLYGYEIAKRLQRANEGEALFKEGTVYPVLRALAAAGGQAFPGPGTPPALEEELRRLRAENKRLLAERDILKKATAFFAKESS